MRGWNELVWRGLDLSWDFSGRDTKWSNGDTLVMGHLIPYVDYLEGGMVLRVMLQNKCLGFSYERAFYELSIVLSGCVSFYDRHYNLLIVRAISFEQLSHSLFTSIQIYTQCLSIPDIFSSSGSLLPPTKPHKHHKSPSPHFSHY